MLLCDVRKPCSVARSVKDPSITPKKNKPGNELEEKLVSESLTDRKWHIGAILKCCIVEINKLIVEWVKELFSHAEISIMKYGR